MFCENRNFSRENGQLERKWNMDINSLSSNYSSLVSDTSSSQTASKLSGASKTDYSNASDKELMDVCKEFEAYFVEQMYKEMKKTIPESEESTSDSNSQLVDYFTDSSIQEISAQTVEQGSLGLAQTLFEQMKRNYDV